MSDKVSRSTHPTMLWTQPATIVFDTIFHDRRRARSSALLARNGRRAPPSPDSPRTYSAHRDRTTGCPLGAAQLGLLVALGADGTKPADSRPLPHPAKPADFTLSNAAPRYGEACRFHARPHLRRSLPISRSPRL
jgi:hypothetical protein